MIHKIYPIIEGGYTREVLSGTCNMCGKDVEFLLHDCSLRENWTCPNCRSYNRQRQIALIAEHRISSDTRVYNTEASRSLHEWLKGITKNYTCSEYFGPEYKSGDLVNGVLCQDLTNLSFPDNSFDVVISSDVLEHIPDWHLSCREIHRVLVTGCAHIFPVPFHTTRDKNDNYGIDTIKKPIIYHKDPIRGGIPVFTIFSIEMLVELEEIGLITNIYNVNDRAHGTGGAGAFVFESIKFDLEDGDGNSKM